MNVMRWWKNVYAITFLFDTGGDLLFFSQHASQGYGEFWIAKVFTLSSNIEAPHNIR